MRFLFLMCVLFWMSSCVEKAEEKVIAMHANGQKKTSLWIYSDGSVLKRNEWYGNGIKELEIPYKNGEPHGRVKRWTAYGNVVSLGKMKKGKKEGEWKTFFDNKKVEKKGRYKEDLKEGEWKAYFYDRKQAWVEYYHRGEAIGLWKSWYPNGILKEENSCHLQEEQGFHRFYSPQGALEWKYQCRFGKKEGTHEVYFANGAVQQRQWYRAGRQDGAVEFFLANGKLWKREFWKAGIRDSVWEWFDSKGDKILESKFVNGNGVAYGLCGKDKPRLVCAESSFVDSKLDGRLFYYKENRELRYEEVWKKGQIIESRSYYMDSLDQKLASEGFWKEGKRHGLWRNWYANGLLMDSLHFLNGERYGHQFSYDSSGNLYMHQEAFGKNRPILMHLQNKP